MALKPHLRPRATCDRCGRCCLEGRCSFLGLAEGEPCPHLRRDLSGQYACGLYKSDPERWKRIIGIGIGCYWKDIIDHEKA